MPNPVAVRRIPVALVTLAVAALLVGCSGSEIPVADPDTGTPVDTPSGDSGTPTANPDGTPNPCDLVSDADLSAALGGAPGDRDQGGEGDAQFCRVRAADSSLFTSVDMLIEPGGQPLFDTLKAQAEQQFPSVAPIDGVGDDAVRIRVDDRGVEIMVLKGLYILGVSLSAPLSADGAEGRVVALATAVVSGL